MYIRSSMLKIFVSLFGAFTLLLCSSCPGEKNMAEVTMQYAQELNNSSYFAGYSLLQVLGENEFGNSGFFVKENENGVTIRGAVSHYPGDSGEYRLTQIFLEKEDSNHVFGISTGDDVQTAREALTREHYKEIDGKNKRYGYLACNENEVVFLKGDIVILFCVAQTGQGDSIIDTISVLVCDPAAEVQSGYIQ